MCDFEPFSGTCDDVMETAWSTMWNVTDETPVNCRRFLDGGGMELFLRCKEVKLSNIERLTLTKFVIFFGLSDIFPIVWT